MSQEINKKEILDGFGKTLINYTRDEVIEINNLIMSGKMNAAEAKELYNLFTHLDGNQQEIVRKFVLNAVDQTMHHFLWMIEQNDEIDLIYKNSENFKMEVSLKDISDGLSAELYTKEGWIERFSKYPPSLKF
jgi:hypothetical protein